MDEYTADKFADDSVDEKRLEKSQEDGWEKSSHMEEVFRAQRQAISEAPCSASDCQPDCSSDTDSG